MAFENGKLLRVTLHAIKSGGIEFVTTLHYDLNDANLGDNDPQSLADTFRDDVIPHYKALFEPDASVQPVVVTMEKDPLNPNAPRQQWTSGTVVPGTRTIGGDRLTQAHCGIASLYTDLIGRRYRGRIFLPIDASEGDINYATWASTVTSLWQSFVDAIPRQPDISPPINDSQANWCVYSRTARAQVVDKYLAHVQSVAVKTQLHYLRSREP